MRGFWLGFLMLSACSHQGPLAAELPAEDLLGNWKLARYHCEKFGFSALGKKLAAPVREGTVEEYYRFEPHRMEVRVLERKPGGAKDAFCESIFEGPLEIRQGRIVSTEYQLRLREGRGGYRCYGELKLPGLQKTEADSAYTIEDGELRIYHQNLMLVEKARSESASPCLGNEDLVQVFTRAPAP